MNGSGRVRRGMHVLVAAALGLTIAGFIAGIRTVAPPRSGEPAERHTPASGEVMPTTPYWALGDRRAGPSRTVTSDVSVLRATLPAPTDPVPPFSAEARAEAVAARAQRRAYDGAPPWVPHPVDEQSSDACLACHRAGMQVAGRTAPVMSHEPRSQCLQCHVSTVAKRPGAEEPAVASGFVGRPSAGRGETAWTGAPPTMPHGVFMREDCGSCHGIAGLPGLRTTHPARKNCTQCHVPVDSPQPFARTREG